MTPILKLTIRFKFMHFGEYLHSERKKLGMSAEKFAKICKVSRSYITLIENGKRLPGKELIPVLAKALNLKTSTVINWYLEGMREKFRDIEGMIDNRGVENR